MTPTTRTWNEIAALRRRIRAASLKNAKGCWVWQRSTKNGYGQMSVRGRCTYTHRLAYELYVGPIPDGLGVLHRCDTPRCNNPRHFFLGTQSDNDADMRAKGRAKKPPVHRGATHHQATLTDKQVAKIRRSSAPQRDVAAQYGCSQSTVWRLRHQVVRAESV